MKGLVKQRFSTYFGGAGDLEASSSGVINLIKNQAAMNYIFTLRILSILLLAAGYGWAGGHFIPADAPIWAYAFQFFMLFILFLLATAFFKTAAGPPISSTRNRRPVIGMTIYAVLTLLINIANIIHGITQNSRYGFHNTLADIIPVSLIIVGDILWLLTSRRMPLPNSAA